MKSNLNEMADSAQRQEGDEVIYRGAWGTQQGVACIITDVGEENGRLVYGNSLGHWGYADQYRGVES